MLADLLSALTSPVPRRNVYILENDSVLYAAPRLRAEHPEATIILLAAADRLVGEIGPPPSVDNHRQPASCLEILTDRQLLQTFLQYYCDGVIAVSRLVADRLRTVTAPTMPIRVVNPYIQPSVYDRLRTVEPELASQTAVTVSQWRAHKGLDLLIEAWPAVRRRHPGAQLRVIGPGHLPGYADTPGVTVCGYVDDLALELANASLYIHPARFEAFGISVVEAMCAGLPALVTDTTGARVAVSEIDDALVTAPTARCLAGAVNRYFAADLGRRTAWSERSRAASEPFTAATQTRRFRNRFEFLLEVVRRGSTVPATLNRGGQPPASTATPSRGSGDRS